MDFLYCVFTTGLHSKLSSKERMYPHNESSLWYFPDHLYYYYYYIFIFFVSFNVTWFLWFYQQHLPTFWAIPTHRKTKYERQLLYVSILSPVVFLFFCGSMGWSSWPLNIKLFCLFIVLSTLPATWCPVANDSYKISNLHSSFLFFTMHHNSSTLIVLRCFLILRYFLGTSDLIMDHFFEFWSLFS